MVFSIGGEEGIRSRLRARSGSALTCHRQVIHYRPVRIPTIKKPSHTQGMARLLWRRGRDSNPCGVAPKRFSRPPRYDRFDTSPYMKLSFDRNHQIFNCFRNSFRNALLCRFRSAEKVSVYKAFLHFCDRYARKFSRPPRYDRFDNSP